MGRALWRLSELALLVVARIPGRVAATTGGNTKCTVDGSDPVTDGFGNVATFTEVIPNANQQDLWAWTAPVGTFYDNDDHATGASKITIETHG